MVNCIEKAHHLSRRGCCCHSSQRVARDTKNLKCYLQTAIDATATATPVPGDAAAAAAELLFVCPHYVGNFQNLVFCPVPTANPSLPPRVHETR
jgi:hypothetical protein